MCIEILNALYRAGRFIPYRPALTHTHTHTHTHTPTCSKWVHLFFFPLVSLPIWNVLYAFLSSCRLLLEGLSLGGDCSEWAQRERTVAGCLVLGGELKCAFLQLHLLSVCFFFFFYVVTGALSSASSALHTLSLPIQPRRQLGKRALVWHACNFSASLYLFVFVLRLTTC